MKDEPLSSATVNTTCFRRLRKAIAHATLDSLQVFSSLSTSDDPITNTVATRLSVPQQNLIQRKFYFTAVRFFICRNRKRQRESVSRMQGEPLINVNALETQEGINLFWDAPH